jgi:hypothetical protein
MCQARLRLSWKRPTDGLSGAEDQVTTETEDNHPTGDDQILKAAGADKEDVGR